VDQRHEEVSDARAVKSPEEQAVLAVQHRQFQDALDNIVV
jgi:hypothetical protein